MPSIKLFFAERQAWQAIPRGITPENLLKQAIAKLKAPTSQENWTLLVMQSETIKWQELDTQETISKISDGDTVRLCDHAEMKMRLKAELLNKECIIADLKGQVADFKIKLNEQVINFKSQKRLLEETVKKLQDAVEETTTEQCREILQDKGVNFMKASSVLPCMSDLGAFLQTSEVPGCKMKPSLVPVGALRFTHHFVNSSLAFGEDHSNSNESIYRLLDDLLRERILPEALSPLSVFKITAPQGQIGLYSRNNRRLLALLMFQAARRDRLVKVPCFVYTAEDLEGDPRLHQWFERGYDGEDKVEGCTGEGLSIFTRRGKSRHRGELLFE